MTSWQLDHVPRPSLVIILVQVERQNESLDTGLVQVWHTCFRSSFAILERLPVKFLGASNTLNTWNRNVNKVTHDTYRKYHLIPFHLLQICTAVRLSWQHTACHTHVFVVWPSRAKSEEWEQIEIWPIRGMHSASIQEMDLSKLLVIIHCDQKHKHYMYWLQSQPSPSALHWLAKRNIFE